MATIPQHNLLIYDKPAQGTDFLQQFEILNYKHRLTSFGGCDSASGTLRLSFTDAEWVYENCIGNAVRVFVDDPLEPVFDGYVSRVTYKIGGVDFTRSLDDMYNQVEIEVYDQAGGTVGTVGGLVNDTVSQGIYMIKRGRINGEVMFGSATASKIVIRNILLAKAAYPTVSFSRGQSAVDLEVELRGWYSVWDWEIYQNTNATVATADTIFRRVTVNTLGELPTNAPFIYATGAGGTGAWADLIQANSGFSLPRTCTNGQTYLEFIESIVEGGDSAVPWVAGITKTNNFDTNIRRVYYRPARTTPFYYQRALAEPGVFRDEFGRKIDPWRIEADRVVVVTDVLFGWNSFGQDPRATYMEAVDYDANAQSVSYVGTDDISPRGTFGVRKRYKVRGRNALKNAPIRSII